MTETVFQVAAIWVGILGFPIGFACGYILASKDREQEKERRGG